MKTSFKNKEINGKNKLWLKVLQACPVLSYYDNVVSFKFMYFELFLP